MTEKGEQLRQRILDLVTEYTHEAFPARKFSAGCDPVPVSGKVFDEAEMRLLVDSSLDFWHDGKRRATSPADFGPGDGVHARSFSGPEVFRRLRSGAGFRQGLRRGRNEI